MRGRNEATRQARCAQRREDGIRAIEDDLVRDLPPRLAPHFVLREHPLVRPHQAIPAPAPRVAHVV